MYTLIAKNKYNEQLELTHNSAYNITDIDGIDPAEAVINVTKNAGADGSVYNSAYVNDRQITITLSVNAPAEINRIALYQFFKPKFPVTLYYQNGTRDVYIDGYVQNVNIGFFDKKQTVQIIINCPQPFFNGTSSSTQEFSSVTSLFEFPFTIDAGIETSGSELLTGSFYDSTKTTNGVTFTVDDGTVTADGTATATASFNVKARDVATPFTLDAGSYYLTGCPAGGSLSTYRIGANYTNSDDEGVFLGADTGDGFYFTIEDDDTPVGIFINVYSGATVDDLEFTPELYAASASWEGVEFSSLATYVEKSIINNGDVETGTLITIQALGAVDTPKIYNVETSESFIINTTLQRGDVVTINTRRGEKAVDLTRDGVTSTLIGYLADGSTWFQLAPADNVFTIDAESGVTNMFVTFEIIDQYEGV